MRVKLIELRDRGTFIPMFAFRVRVIDERPTISNAEQYLAYARARYPRDGSQVILGRLDSPKQDTHCDPYEWGNLRMQQAHVHLIKEWENINSGDVIDIEFLLGEKLERKISERLEHL